MMLVIYTIRKMVMMMNTETMWKKEVGIVHDDIICAVH